MKDKLIISTDLIQYFLRFIFKHVLCICGDKLDDLVIVVHTCMNGSEVVQEIWYKLSVMSWNAVV